MTTCECSEDFGPCERHGVVLAQYEGASLRTADELAAVFLLEAKALGADVSAEDVALAESVTGWIDDDTGETQDQLMDAVLRAETSLPEGLITIWNDGVSIVRVKEDCPL